MKLILLVEDEYGNAEVLQLLLEAEGYRVAHAANGRDALALLAGEKPAVILSDFMMPHMTGGELGQAVRADPSLKDIPFVVLSASHESVVQASFKDYDAFVVKPSIGTELVKVLAHLIATGRPRRRSPSDRDPRSDEMDYSLRQLLRGIEIPPG